MTVSMGIKHRDSGEYEVVQLATSNTFDRVWVPAAEELGLELVPHFGDGALNSIPPELVPQIVAEVTRLREWAATQPDYSYFADRCTDILEAFGRTDPSVCEYDFG